MLNGVGSRLKEIRQQLKLTQQQLGDKLGINGSAVGKYEIGISFPTGKMLDLLATQYNVSMDYLLCGRGTLFYDDEDTPDWSRSEGMVEGDKELEELFSLVTSMSWVRHAVVGYFQRFRLEHRHLIDKGLQEDPGNRE